MKKKNILKGKIKLKPKDTAVIVIDMQNGYCSPKGFSGRVLKRDLSPVVMMSKKMPKFLDKMRKMGIELIWFRTDYQAKKVPKNIYEAETLVHGLPFAEISKKGTFDYEYYLVKPEKNEKEFVKTHLNAFQNKKFASYLKQRKIKNLIFIGVWTSRCVFSSIIGASTLGYRCLMLKDLTAITKERTFENKAACSVIHGLLGFCISSKEILELFK
jgi:ureidoacrylate peracid hydrolase